jgi:two-component system LytT family response regulator
MFRALIIDDEFYAREELAALLRETGGCEVIGACANAIEGIKVINRDRPDVLFLDIQMPVIGGFELLGMIDREIMPHVVFVTAYDQFALKAFEEKTLDYLLKPVDQGRLAKTFEKLQDLLRRGEAPSIATAPITRIPCVSGNRIKLINPRELDHVRADLSGVHVVQPNGESFTDLTLRVIEERTQLVRCHRQYLVNVDCIDEIRLLEHGLGEIKSKAGHLLPVSRRYLKSLKNLLGF